METVIDEIAAERKRQIEKEGWSAEHDADYVDGCLGMAAACYAAPVPIYTHDKLCEDGVTGRISINGAWPWDSSWWKPKSRRRDLIRAAALIVAEIERIDRSKP